MPSCDARILGLDVGGANLKAADARGIARSTPFPLWKHPDGLADALAQLAAPFQFDRLAVAMTGELCDCFETRREGVARIVAALRRFAGTREIRIWSTAGRFVEADEATGAAIDEVQAANWHALATYAARWTAGQPALLIDVGSTTTDIVPIVGGRPVPAARTDCGRLATGELVYLGVERTPLCAILPTVQWQGRAMRTMAEWFATTLDVFTLTGDLKDDAHSRATADGRPATRWHAANRLARTIGLDRDSLSEEGALAIAEQARARIVAELGAAVANVARSLRVPRPQCVVAAGQGEFLIRQVLRSLPGYDAVEWISLTERLGAATSTAACAFALATLGSET